MAESKRDKIPFVSGVIKGNSNSTLLKDVRLNSRAIWEKKQHYYLLKYISLEKKYFRKINNSGLYLVHLSFFCEERKNLI